MPVKLVQQASALLPELEVADQDVPPGINEFAGSQEERFMALHYTRILAELAGVFYKRAGQLHLKKAFGKLYEREGLSALFLRMLEAATRKFNWGYFDLYDEGADLQSSWLFMVWRLQARGSVDGLRQDLDRVFPALVDQVSPTEYASAELVLSRMIECRFVECFPRFWGFVNVVVDRATEVEGRPYPKRLIIQPLMREVFQFDGLK